MRNIGLAFLLGLFSTIQVAAQTDSSRVTPYIPPLWIKWDILPGMLQRNILVGLEARVLRQHAVGFIVGRQFPPRFWYAPNTPLGWNYDLQLRRFSMNPKLHGGFVSLDLRKGSGAFNFPAHFEFPGNDYYKSVHIQEQFQTITMSAGWLSANRKYRFPYEMSLGAGFGWRTVELTGTNDTEYAYIYDGNIASLQPYKPGHYKIPMITANIAIGFTLVR